MNKRHFLRLAGTSALGSLALPYLGCQGSSSSEPTVSPTLPTQWMWWRPRLEQPDDAYKRIFDQMAEAGMEAVLPEIFNGNQAFFQLDGFDVAEPLLERLIPLAHAAGLQLHAWMWTMPCTNPGIIEAHPDWYAVNGLGEPAHEKPAYVDYYKWLCPCHPEVIEFVRHRVATLASYAELDGIHIDYVRLPDVILAEALQPKYDIVQDKEYPQYDYCYSSYCREAFKEQTGLDPLTDLEDPAANDAWRQFRYDSITQLVNGHLVPEARKANKYITAAVFPNWQYVRQEWHAWKLDGFLPMLYHGFYNQDLAWIGEETKAALERLDHQRPVFSGLFLPDLSGEELATSLDIAREAGSKGFALFDYNSMKPEHWEVLKGRRMDT